MKRDHDFERPRGWRGVAFCEDVAKAPGMRQHPSEPIALRRLRKPAEEAVGLWNIETGALVRFWPGLLDAAWTPSGDHVLCVSAHDHVNLELFSWPAFEEVRRARLAFDLRRGLGGAVLTIATGGRFGALELYSGQSEEGYVVFTLPDLATVASLPYVYGETAAPCAFSHDERWMAFVYGPSGAWWTGDDDDADWDTPANGGRVRWAMLCLEDLRPPGGRSEHPILVDVEPGWVPPEALVEEWTWPRGVRFESADEMRFELPWGGECRIRVPPTLPCVVGGPRR
jgi:hypothetical protein